MQVGRLVEYVGRVVYAAEDGSLRVNVKAHRLSLRTGRCDPANQFHFIFSSSGRLLSVQPETYEEGMLYLEGRRRWLNDSGSAESPPGDTW